MNSNLEIFLFNIILKHFIIYPIVYKILKSPLAYNIVVIFVRYYLVGIKGCALTALANLLYEKGHTIKGCDIETDFYTKPKLDKFIIENINEITLDKRYFYIIGNAYINHNLAKKIKELGYHNLSYPEFISKYFKYHKQLCVSGSHGKTRL